MVFLSVESSRIYGEAPQTLNSYFIQQSRWSQGSIGIFFQVIKLLFTRKNVDDLFIYDLKDGKLTGPLIHGEFYAIGDVYMNEDLPAILERLEDYGYVTEQGSVR